MAEPFLQSATPCNRSIGIADITLEPLTLQVNFRSAQAVTSWVNDSFSEIFPKTADSEIGAVPYSPSAAFQSMNGAVQVWPMIDAQISSESAFVAETVVRALDADASQSVAILLRSRGQAGPVFEATRCIVCVSGAAIPTRSLALAGSFAITGLWHDPP